MFSGNKLPHFKNKRYLDGGFTNNLPVFDSSTITVSPLAGMTKNIAPVDSVNNKIVRMVGEDLEVSTKNAQRFIQCVKAISDKTLDEHFKSGFRDTETYLRKRGLTDTSK